MQAGLISTERTERREQKQSRGSRERFQAVWWVCVLVYEVWECQVLFTNYQLALHAALIAALSRSATLGRAACTVS
jgi:hypothetical protein